MAKAKKKRKLVKLDIHELSIVDSPATGIGFYFVKNENEQTASGFQIVEESRFPNPFDSLPLVDPTDEDPEVSLEEYSIELEAALAEVVNEG